MKAGSAGAALALAFLATACSSHAASTTPLTAVSPAAVASSSAPTVSPSAEAITSAMHLRHVVAYTAVTDPNHMLGRHDGYTSKAGWNVSAEGESSIEVFATVALARARLAYLSSFTPPLGDGYDYRDGTALLRLDSSYTPAQARTLARHFRKAVS